MNPAKPGWLLSEYQDGEQIGEAILFDAGELIRAYLEEKTGQVIAETE